MYFMIGQIRQGSNTLIKRYDKYMHRAITHDTDSLRCQASHNKPAAGAGVTDRTTLAGWDASPPHVTPSILSSCLTKSLVPIYTPGWGGVL